jgi:hypothetical protein
MAQKTVAMETITTINRSCAVANGRVLYLHLFETLVVNARNECPVYKLFDSYDSGLQGASECSFI